MKKGSILINVGRAGLVDQNSVLKAVKSGYLGCRFRCNQRRTIK